MLVEPAHQPLGVIARIGRLADAVAFVGVDTNCVSTPKAFNACQNSCPCGSGTSASRSPCNTNVGVWTRWMNSMGLDRR